MKKGETRNLSSGRRRFSFLTIIKGREEKDRPRVRTSLFTKANQKGKAESLTILDQIGIQGKKGKREERKNPFSF